MNNVCNKIGAFPSFQVNDLISNNQLNICSEEKVFVAVLNWLKHDLTERKQHIAEVSSFLFEYILSGRKL